MALKAIITVVALMVLFEIIGMAFSCVIRKKQDIALNMLYGYLIYFSIFEVLYLICLALKNDLKILGIAWLVVLAILIASAILISRKILLHTFEGLAGFVAERWKQIVIIVVFTLTMLFIYILGLSYVTEDSYSYACISDAIATRKMFLRDVYTGVDIKVPDIIYALSGYYMHSAVICKALKLSAVSVQHNIIGIITILLSVDAIYLIGKELMKDKSWMIACFIILYEAANLYLLLYSNERYFLFTGACDEMSQIPYILIPVIVLGFIRLLKENESGWNLVLLGGMAGCALSVSSIMVVPMTILCGTITVAIYRKSIREMASGGICLISGIIYIIIYCVCK